MVNKYVTALEQMEICSKTGEVWTINDVPNTWRNKVQKKVLADGYVFDEEGRAVIEVEEEVEPEEEA